MRDILKTILLPVLVVILLPVVWLLSLSKRGKRMMIEFANKTFVDPTPDE